MAGIKIFLLVLSLTWKEIVSEDVQNKTKRGLGDQTHYITSFKPINVYPDPTSSPTQPQGITNYLPRVVSSVKPLYEPEPKVTAQQVLYEYQQTPTNTVSNVHFNQQYQSIPQPPQAEGTQQVAYTQYTQQQPHPIHHHSQQFVPHQQIQQPHQSHHYSQAETVVNPVQHSSIIQHNPYVSTPQSNPYLLGKYLYLNGKVVYNANPTQVQPQLHHPLQRPVPQKLPYQKLSPPPYVAPISYQNYQQIEKTTPKPIIKQEVKKVVEEDDDEESENVQEQEEDEDNRYREEDEDDDQPRYREKDEDPEYGRYSFEHEDEEQERYKEEQEEDDDEDNQRDTTKYYHKKEPKRYSSTYKYKEGYKTKTKNQKPYKTIKSSKSSKSNKPEYQAYKYSKGPNGKPKIEVIQGKPSQNIPVTVQKVYREKWFITRNNGPEQ